MAREEHGNGPRSEDVLHRILLELGNRFVIGQKICYDTRVKS